MEWQPIDTAPQDGTEVLLFGTWAGEIHGPDRKVPPAIYIGAYEGGGDYSDDGYLWSVVGGDMYAAWCKPSHWMPMPAPPTAPQAE